VSETFIRCMVPSVKTMEECPVCYCETARCKLVCGHSFCKTCVKSWFYKATDEPSCPMCRKRLYFKGMYKVVPVWEEERLEMLKDEVFAEALEEVLAPADDSEYEGTESEWSSESESEFDYRMYDILDIEERITALNRAGIPIHAEFLSEWYDVVSEYEHFFYEDERSYLENMFVSKHPLGPSKGRHGTRNQQEKRDAPCDVVVFVVV